MNGVSLDEQYTFDQIARLTNTTLTKGTTTTYQWHAYDSVGNRVKQWWKQGASSPWTITGYTINQQNNQLWQATVPGITQVYSYDANGATLYRNTTGTQTWWKYTWDVSGNLRKVENSGVIKGIYAYDGLGRRVESVEGSTTTFYAYLGTETLYESSGNTVTDYVYANGLRIARVSGNSINYYHTDHLGSTRLVTNRPNNLNQVDVIWSDSYQPFGQDNGSPTCSQQNCSHNHKFAGKPYSQATGLYYNFQRWYDPEVGRFISQDPVKGYRSVPQSLNPYTYVLNSPLNGVDPTGLDCFSSLGDFGNCVWGVTIGAGIDSYNWYQTASDADRNAFGWAVLSGVAVGLGIGALCAATAGLGCVGAVAVLAGVGASFGGGLVARGVYRATGGKSEGGLNASGFWGGIGAGLGFGAGQFATTRLLEAAGLRLPSEVASTFAEGTAARVELEADLTAFQYGNGASWASRFVSPVEYASAAEARAGLSLPPWNFASFVRQVTIPRGTTTWMGEVAPRFGLPGGGIQIYVPNIARIIPGPWSVLIPV